MSEEQLVNIRQKLTRRNQQERLNTLYILIGCAGLLTHIFFISIFFYFEITQLVYLNIGSILCWAYVLHDITQKNWIQATWVATFEILLHSIIASYILGIDSGFYLYLWPLGLWLTYSPHLSYQKGLTAGLSCVLILTYLTLVPTSEQSTGLLTEQQLNQFLSLNTFLAALLLVICTLIIRAINQYQQQQLTNLAVRDKLTGLYNRLYFYNFIEQYKHKADRTQEPYCFAIADIDNFKQINDNFGHSTGDEVLVQVARILSNQLRYEDVVVRWGGEEFLIVLVNCELRLASERIDLLRQQVERELSTLIENEHFNITLSFGISSPYQNEGVTELLSRVDKLLYQAKQNGKNCIVAE